MSEKIESLYRGDIRLDNFLNEIEALIYDKCEGRDIPFLTIIGVLDRVKWNLMKDLDS